MKHMKENGEPLINSQAEAEKVVEALSGDAEDLIDIIKEQATEEALETLRDLQTGIEALIEFYDKD